MPRHVLNIININNYGDEPISTYDCFYQNDINILREIVGINESLMHEPINIGYQSWVNGRIILLDLGYSNITEDGLNYRMKPIYRESGNNTVLSVRKDSGHFIDFSRSISGPFSQLVKLSLNLTTVDEAKQWVNNGRRLVL